MKTFKSKLGIGLLLPVLPFVIVAVNSISQRNWILVVISISCLFLLSVLFITTKYIIKDERLNIKSGIFYNLSINIMSIRKINETNNILSSPAMSLDRLEILYNKFDSVIVSPEEKASFIAQLCTINPNIEIKYKKTDTNDSSC